VKPDPSSRTAGLIFSLAFFPLGLGGVALGLSDVIQGYKSLAWQPTPAVVLTSTLTASTLSPAQPTIRYRYTFDGSPYVSERIWPGHVLAYMPELSNSASERIMSEFSKGSIITAYVNPSDPSRVALVPGPRKATRWLLIFVFFLSIGVLKFIRSGGLSRRFVRGSL
jgi:hypothetical protein